MKRKLCSVLLSAFALLLLMGAAPQPATLVTEEESAASAGLETDVQSYDEVKQAVHAAAGASPLKLAENTDSSLLIDGVFAPDDLGKFQKEGVTYVALAAMALELEPTAQVNWTATAGVVTVTTDKLSLTAKVGQNYLEANGRYLYLPQGVELVNGQVTVPMWAVVKAFDATLGWDAATGTTLVNRGSGAILSGEQYYNQEDLFWLSRVIYAESGNQSLEGQMAVGNVVMNRVANPIFPNTIHDVLAQKNQFSTYKNGRIANREPNASSVIAAKLVLDGGVVEETEGALYFDSCSRSWASRNKECIAILGGHKFYA